MRRRLKNVADSALAEGITLPMHTTYEIIRAGDEDKPPGEGEGRGGMDFIVSVISSEALEAKVRDAALRICAVRGG